MARAEALDLQRFGIDPRRGFLPSQDPLASFPGSSDPFLKKLDELGNGLPELLGAHKLRSALEKLEVPDLRVFGKLDKRTLTRACMVYSFLASAYVHQIGEPKVGRIPKGVAVPLHHLSARLGRVFPILSYDLYCLNNWKRLDAKGPIELGNLDTIQKFVRIPDEPWFILVHTEIESEAAPAIRAIGEAQQGALENDAGEVQSSLERMAGSLGEMVATLKRMPDGNSPDVYAFAFRPYIQKFEGILYEGVPELKGPQTMIRGETGAQSSILPSIDIALGITHGRTDLTDYVADMRNYMPQDYRKFIEAVLRGPSIRDYVKSQRLRELTEPYNLCLDHIRDFRQQHYDYAVSYIQQKVVDPSGTGGTPFIKFLTQMRDETEKNKL